MSSFSDLDMLYDYEKDVSAAASGYMTFATKASSDEIRHRYVQLANEASKVYEHLSRLIEKSGGTL
ncbi:spore coat protein [Dehalobacter sp. DCM]|uniref:spore coat protein n=1 Tax=Dehalobacter sp. DCM TaxID=2907827 RepID=UPI0030812E76|nr:spore coat protein [Dehalobacter sp. DCM]